MVILPPSMETLFILVCDICTGIGIPLSGRWFSLSFDWIEMLPSNWPMSEKLWSGFALTGLSKGGGKGEVR